MGSIKEKGRIRKGRRVEECTMKEDVKQRGKMI